MKKRKFKMEKLETDFPKVENASIGGSIKFAKLE